MVDVNIVHARIERIRKCVSKIKKVTRTHAKAEFLNDSDAIDVAEHNIQMAIQCVGAGICGCANMIQSYE